MIRQYLSIKEQYPDALLFYRMGDFYEMFFEDAKIASKILEITLTARNKNDEKSVPMCGVPYRAVRGYIAKLMEKGLKVAICDQVEDPSKAKGLVKREVVRVITPGMIMENEFLDSKTNNFILAISKNRKDLGISYLDISTGIFRLCQSSGHDSIKDEILRISPSEILMPRSFEKNHEMSGILSAVSHMAVSYVNDNFFDYDNAREMLTDHFKTVSLEGFGCEDLKAGVGAAGALLHYVMETQKQKAGHFSAIETYYLKDYLIVDDQSCRNLELSQNLRTGGKNGTLLNVIDKTITAMGGRLLKMWLRYPLLKIPEIKKRLDAIEEAKENMSVTIDIREKLKSVYDLERLGSRIVMGHATGRDLIALKRSLMALPGILSLVSSFANSLFGFEREMESLNNLAALIEKSIREDAPPTINEGGIIKQGFNPGLDELIKISRDGKGWLARLEAKEREATGINSLKVRYNKVFGYYLEVSKAHSDKVPAHYVRKQTLVNAERYITDELKKFESKVLNAEDARASLEYEIFNKVRDEVKKHHRLIMSAAKFVAGLDCILNLAFVADQNDYCRPEINKKGEIIIKEGRHPVIEKMITGERFVPNSIKMDNNENQILIITGPNMAGKSTILRQVALLTIMAQTGSFVPAKSAAICVTDRIFTRVGALDNLSRGQSTFMVEMQETANILNNATPRSLVILDEIGRGTSTFDGLSIAWAVAEYLHDIKNRGVKTLFATHYHELIDLARTKPRVKNFNIAVREIKNEIIFLRKLVKGGTNKSYGIQVARLAGVPEKVTQRAKQVLERIEKESHNPNDKNIVKEEEKSFDAGHIQLGLFCDVENSLVKMVQKLDISKMTPGEAFDFLRKLKDKTTIRYK